MDINARPSWPTFTLGIIFPLVVIVLELVFSISSDFYFIPMPSIFHVLLVAGVPLSNFLIWRALGNPNNLAKPVILSWLSTLSIAVAFYYTLVYLPVLPMAIIGIIIFGMGLLPYGPLSALYGAWSYRKVLISHKAMPALPRYQLLKSIAIIFILLTIIDIPKSATLIGMKLAASEHAQTQEQGITLISSIGSLGPLIDLSYEQNIVPSAALGFIIGEFMNANERNSNHARTVLFKVTGKSYLDFQARKTEPSGFDFIFRDTNQASDNVGQILPYLQLVSSNIDGDINVEDGFSYVEWTMEVKNDDVQQREARFALQLPPEAVVSRVTLWVNGEPQEAAFAKTSQVKQAYTNIVRRRLDPFLVTSNGPQRIMLQAFPVPRKGGKMKFKVGITSAFDFATQKQASVNLPRLIKRNFTLAPQLNHSLWLESKTPFTMGEGSKAKPIDDGSYRLTQQLDYSLVESGFINMQAKREKGAKNKAFSTIDGMEVNQELRLISNKPKDRILLVLDASASMASHLLSINNALACIPNGMRVDIIRADEHTTSMTIEQWSNSDTEQVKAFILAANRDRGFDNMPALIKALKQLEGDDSAQLLWIHGPQPIVFSATSNMLEQTLTRIKSIPPVAVYSIDASVNKAFNNLNWLSTAQQVNQSNEVEKELGDFFKNRLHPQKQWKMHRTLQQTLTPQKQQNSHVARLWAFDEIRRLIDAKDYEQAGLLGEKYQLVTPVTGAVVLETKAQYDENDLQQVDQEIVPQVPTPAPIYLLLPGIFAMLWFKRKK